MKRREEGERNGREKTSEWERIEGKRRALQRKRVEERVRGGGRGTREKEKRERGGRREVERRGEEEAALRPSLQVGPAGGGPAKPNSRVVCSRLGLALCAPLLFLILGLRGPGLPQPARTQTIFLHIQFRSTSTAVGCLLMLVSTGQAHLCFVPHAITRQPSPTPPK